MSSPGWKAVDVISRYRNDDGVGLTVVVLEQNLNTGDYRTNELDTTELPKLEQ